MDRHADRAAALASLRARWGAAAPRPAVEVFGALAAAPLPAEAGAAPALPALPGALPGTPGILPRPVRPALVPLPGGAHPAPAPAARPLPGEPAGDVDHRIPTGFPELDALLAAGGLPRAGTVALRGNGSSGATTLALRTVAEAQAGGALVAWVDLARSLDPVEAAARGVRLEWLAVLVPGSVDEALAMAGSLLQARAVDLLVLDLAGARDGSLTSTASPVTRTAPAARRAGPRPPRLADRLGRLVAFARRAGALLLVLEPAGVPASLRGALEEGAGLRLELRRRGWIRLGREVVGQRTEVRVAKDHHGVPGPADDHPPPLRGGRAARPLPRPRRPPRRDRRGRRGCRARHSPRPIHAVGAPGIERCASSTSPGPTSPSGSRGSAIPRSRPPGR